VGEYLYDLVDFRPFFFRAVQCGVHPGILQLHEGAILALKLYDMDHGICLVKKVLIFNI